MTLQMANYYKHALSLAALSEEAAALQCLNRPACSCCIHRFKYENAGCVSPARICGCVSTYSTGAVHSCTCLPLCHIRESADESGEGSAGAGDGGEGVLVRAKPITAVCGMAAYLSACLSGRPHWEPVLACWSLSTNTKYHSESFSAPVGLMRSAC